MPRLFFFPFFALLLMGCNLARNAKGASPALFGMDRIGENVFVDPEMKVDARRRFLASIDSARGLTQRAFGTLLSKPKIIGCSSEECFKSFGEEYPKAKAYHHWWILVSPRGLLAFVVSHELAHAELHRRLGFYRTFFDYPHWRDEGMAVWVSQDPRYLDSSGIKPGYQTEIEEEKYEEEWARLMEADTPKAYGFACWAFLEWRKRNPEMEELWAK